MSLQKLKFINTNCLKLLKPDKYSSFANLLRTSALMNLCHFIYSESQSYLVKVIMNKLNQCRTRVVCHTPCLNKAYLSTSGVLQYTSEWSRHSFYETRVHLEIPNSIFFYETMIFNAVETEHTKLFQSWCTAFHTKLYWVVYVDTHSIECIDGHDACPYRVQISSDTFPVILGTCTLSVLRVVQWPDISKYDERMG